MIEELQQKIGEEAETLLHELNVILPGEIEKAVAQGDLRENSEYTAALERQGFVRARLDYLARRMSQLGEIDIEHVPTDRVGFGSKVRVRDVADDEIECFNLTIGDNIDFDNNDISMESPIGRALLGKKKGESVSVILPAGAREFEVIGFETLHDLQQPRTAG
ncbi:GreA/GreB family elongation factor [Candidatus Palauibacter sp.]|uniref:GreA/GreB family elongation factor n=1 Tax=Candidatus Palauibacter sp. TaxID=3101350 RepID=UPI003AF20B8B